MGSPSPLSLVPPLALAMRFGVVVGGLSLGMWSSCQGLAVTIKPGQTTALGLNGYRQILLPSIEYQPVVLERAVDSRSSAALQSWLTREITNWYRNNTGGRPYIGQTATITLYDTHTTPVVSWTLQGVYPTKWSGPKLSSNNAVAIESLELTHEGFLQIDV
jgi:phage tail-like protein